MAAQLELVEEEAPDDTFAKKLNASSEFASSPGQAHPASASPRQSDAGGTPGSRYSYIERTPQPSMGGDIAMRTQPSAFLYQVSFSLSLSLSLCVCVCMCVRARERSSPYCVMIRHQQYTLPQCFSRVRRAKQETGQLQYLLVRGEMQTAQGGAKEESWHRQKRKACLLVRLGLGPILPGPLDLVDPSFPPLPSFSLSPSFLPSFSSLSLSLSSFPPRSLSRSLTRSLARSLLSPSPCVSDV